LEKDTDGSQGDWAIGWDLILVQVSVSPRKRKRDIKIHGEGQKVFKGQLGRYDWPKASTGKMVF